jgi:hypothetical protein
MVRKSWSLGGRWGGHIDLELVGHPSATDDAARAETRLLIAQVGQEFLFGDRNTRRVVLEICSVLGGGPLGSVRHNAQGIDAGSAGWESYTDVLMRAADTGTLIARRRNVRRIIMQTESPAEVLGPAPDSAPEPDVYVLAAEVKLIGDTPLINHAVRVLDPDTGEVVADGLTTDDKGIVRTDVPANKTYRIEIVDRDPDLHILPTLRTKHPRLRCAFVDMAGSPVPDLDVTVKDLDGQSTDYTSDDDGMLEVPAELGLYEVTVGDEAYWVHSLMHDDDDDDAYELVVPSKLEDGKDGIDPDDRLTRSWDDDDDDDDDDDGDDDGDST